MKLFSTLFKGGRKPSIIPVIKAMYPPLRFLVRVDTLLAPLINMDYSQHQLTPRGKRLPP